MPGARATYNAINFDVEFRYSDDHEFCVAQAIFPSDAVDIVGVYITFGTLIAQPFIWNADYDNDTEVDSTTIETLIAAGIVYVRADFPKGPANAVDSRHPFMRLPDAWRSAGKVVQYMKTHALDGRITGTRSRTLPVDHRGYVVSGDSGGAVVAGMLAFASDGALPYDKDASWNMSPWKLTASHRVAGCALFDFPTGDFRIFADSISSAAMPFFGVAERFYPDTTGVNDIQRFEVLSDENKLAASLVPMAQLDLEENRTLGVFLSSSAQGVDESSYRGSGATFGYSALASGTTAGAVKVTVNADPTKVATIKLIQATFAGTTTYIYAESDSGTVIADFTGTLNLLNAAGATVGTLTSASGYTIVGEDTQRAYVTKQAVLATIDAAPGEPIAELTSPHRVEHSALLQRARELIRDRHGLTGNWHDRYYIGSAYPAQISGDSAAFPYNNTTSDILALLAWMQEELDWVL